MMSGEQNWITDDNVKRKRSLLDHGQLAQTVPKHEMIVNKVLLLLVELTGECMKTSIAEKRRIAPDTELQYVLSTYSTEGTQQQLIGDGSDMIGGHAYSQLKQQSPQFANILMIAVGVCILSITILTIIIVVLQHRNNKVLKKFEKRLNNSRRNSSKNDFRVVADYDNDVDTDAYDDDNGNSTNRRFFEFKQQNKDKMLHTTKLPSKRSFCAIHYFDNDNDENDDCDYDYDTEAIPIKLSSEVNTFEMNDDNGESDSKTPLIHVMIKSTKATNKHSSNDDPSSNISSKVVGINNKSNTSTTS